MTLARCTRCRHQVRNPVIVEGRGYGPVCARKVSFADLLTQQPATSTRRARMRRGDERQLVLEASA